MILIFVLFSKFRTCFKCIHFQNYEPVYFLYNTFSVALTDEKVESSKKENQVESSKEESQNF